MFEIFLVISFLILPKGTVKNETIFFSMLLILVVLIAVAIILRKRGRNRSADADNSEL